MWAGARPRGIAGRGEGTHLKETDSGSCFKSRRIKSGVCATRWWRILGIGPGQVGDSIIGAMHRFWPWIDRPHAPIGDRRPQKACASQPDAWRFRLINIIELILMDFITREMVSG